MNWCFRESIPIPKGHLSFVEKWPMMNPNDLAFILVIYLLFVLKIGPHVMESRQPLQIKWLLITYNALKVINSAVLAYKFLSYVMDMGLFPRNCEYDDFTVYKIAALYWKYMVTKILDLCDTVFFVLRKKSSQMTFLHVYHHVFMVIMAWTCLKYDPSDHWAFLGVINCSIHTIMYTYYGLSAMGPKFSKYLYWKKYVTLMQLIQFVLVIAHLIVQTYTSQCPMHAGNYWMGLSNLMLFIFLFMDFYKKRYKSKTQEIVAFSCSGHVD